MKTLLLCTSLLAAVSPVLGVPVTFDTDAVGQQQAGWTCGTTGKGNPRWTVETDASAPSPPNVLKQAGTATFPWCVKNDTQAENGSVEVKFKPISGKEDQAGGVVWRWKDGNNYYVARECPRKQFVVVLHGKRLSQNTQVRRCARCGEYMAHA